MWQLLLFSAGCIPALILLSAVYFEGWRRRQRGERQPLSDKLLRPPGYSLQRMLNDLTDSFMAWFMGAAFFGVLVVIFPRTMPADAFAPIVAVSLFATVSAVCTVVALRKLYRIRDYRRGLLGEQAVAEELQRMIPCGYKIFHDIPCVRGDSKWNIDHVAVGPAGVFAIETKYRTKRPGKNGERDHEAIFDGDRIEFSSGDYDAKAAGQARNNARWLEKELSAATGERVAVQPIVALPGWYVTLKVDSDVKVLSGKQIYNYITKGPVEYQHKLIHQICHQLEQRCRDVEV